MQEIPDARMATVLSYVPRDPDSENHFFEDGRYFPGRPYDPRTNRVVQPHEALKLYETVLAQVRRVAPDRYGLMHKGTPFYIMGWLAYEMKDYERGVFYMDSALSEDVKNNPQGWIQQPAASFLFLDDSNMNAAARDITVETRRVVDEQCKRYSTASSTSINAESLVGHFIKPDSTDPTHRSIVTAFLTFLLEGEDRKLQVSLRSAHGGSLEPFLTHLFKGGLTFESILKRHFGKAGKDLGGYLSAAKADLDLKKEVYKSGKPYKLEDLPSLLKTWQSEAFQERSVAIAYAVRNTSGHDLGWQDIFQDATLYTQLFEGIADAIFWTIQKKYAVKSGP